MPSAFAQTVQHVWVTGYYDFLDENGNATDASRVNVCLYDANSNGTSFALLYNGATAGCEELNDNGYYTITVGNVDADDPTTGADITPIFSFNTTQVITNYNSTVYDVRGAINYNVNGTLIIGSEANTNSTLDKVFRIHDTINEGYDFSGQYNYLEWCIFPNSINTVQIYVSQGGWSESDYPSSVSDTHTEYDIDMDDSLYMKVEWRY